MADRLTPAAFRFSSAPGLNLAFRARIASYSACIFWRSLRTVATACSDPSLIPAAKPLPAAFPLLAACTAMVSSSRCRVSSAADIGLTACAICEKLPCTAAASSRIAPCMRLGLAASRVSNAVAVCVDAAFSASSADFARPAPDSMPDGSKLADSTLTSLLIYVTLFAACAAR